MGHIMEDWANDQKIPSTKNEKPKMQRPKTKYISSKEDGVEQEKGNGTGKNTKDRYAHKR